jgi:hypothetical protein
VKTGKTWLSARPARHGRRVAVSGEPQWQGIGQRVAEFTSFSDL